MKTVTDVNTVNQLLTYSKQAEAGIHQKAIQMLLGAGNNKKQDSLSIFLQFQMLFELSVTLSYPFTSLSFDNTMILYFFALLLPQACLI